MGIRVHFDPAKGIVSTSEPGNGSIDLSTFGISKSNSTITDPTTSDDVLDGYSIGSRWYNTSSQEEFVCLSSAQGAAVWTSTTSGGGSSSSTGGPLATTVWVADSTVSSSAYPNNVRYVPLRNNSTDSIEFQFVSEKSGTLSASVLYAMSSAEANVVSIQFDQLVLGIGSSPATAATLGTAFNVTPGSDVLLHSMSVGNNSSFYINTDTGNIVYCKLTRSGSADSHTGDLRVLEIRMA